MTSRLIAVAGSGRSGANSTRLLAEALAGAAEAGAGEGRVHRLAELDYRGCVGCGACRRDAEACVLRDDLTPVLADTAAAGALVLATPIYYGYATGLLKSYLDRWYAFRDGARQLRLPAGRPALLVVTQGHPDPEAYAWTLGSLEKVLAAYGFEARLLVAPGLEAAGAVEGRPEPMTQARAWGAALPRAPRPG